MVCLRQGGAKYASVDAMTPTDDLRLSPFARAQSAQAAARKRLLARRQAAARASLAPRHKTGSTKTPAHSPKQAIGAHYEHRALDYLMQAGLRPLARNPSCRMGEIDLVLRDGDVLVLVEVRARRDRCFGGAAASITLAKQRRLIRAASLLLPALLRLMAQDRSGISACGRHPGIAVDPAPGLPESDRPRAASRSWRPDLARVRFDVVTFENDAIQWLPHAFALC